MGGTRGSSVFLKSGRKYIIRNATGRLRSASPCHRHVFIRPRSRTGPAQGEATFMSSDNTQSLKSIGLKATYPRLRILDLFQNSETRHLTAEDVYRQLITDGMDIG